MLAIASGLQEMALAYRHYFPWNKGKLRAARRNKAIQRKPDRVRIHTKDEEMLPA